jgi:hypothetical protein
MALEANLQKHFQEHGLSKEEYLDSINSIINEAPDLFASLQNDHFD